MNNIWWPCRNIRCLDKSQIPGQVFPTSILQIRRQTVVQAKQMREDELVSADPFVQSYIFYLMILFSRKRYSSYLAC